MLVKLNQVSSSIKEIYYNQDTFFAASKKEWQLIYDKDTVSDYIDDETLIKIKRDKYALTGWTLAN